MLTHLYTHLGDQPWPAARAPGPCKARRATGCVQQRQQGDAGVGSRSGSPLPCLRARHQPFATPAAHSLLPAQEALPSQALQVSHAGVEQGEECYKWMGLSLQYEGISIFIVFPGVCVSGPAGPGRRLLSCGPRIILKAGCSWRVKAGHQGCFQCRSKEDGALCMCEQDTWSLRLLLLGGSRGKTPSTGEILHCCAV